MATNKLKVMLSFMREVNDGNIPSAEDYQLEKMAFYDIIEACQEEGLIKGVRFKKNAVNEIIFAFLDGVKLTVKGLEYLNNNSALMKTYKGLKALREWLPF